MSVFEVTIQRKDEDAWPVVVRHQPSAQALARWSRGRLELDPGALESLLPSQKEYGLRLGQTLFRDDIRDAFVGAMAGAEGEDELLRVLLIIEADELRDLHWEQLCAPLDRGWETLLLNQRTPFSLYLPSQIERRFPPFGRRDLRALLLVAGPEELEDDRLGLDPFDVTATVDSLRQAMGPIPCDVLARVEEASGPPRLDVLCQQIATKADAEAYTLLHIVCHGAYREATGETLLYFPQDEGLRPVLASTLIEHLGRLRRLPHLTFLSTCESADPRAEAGLGGLGQRLVRELGMPAAVAMTGRISADTAGALASAFYARLRESGEVDCALSAALVGLQGRADVTVPALFSRLGGRTLWTDALDRPLTEAEIGYGLGQMGALLDERAPVLKSEFESLAAGLRARLEVDPAALSAEARRERQAALAAANQLCSEALDLSFNALALGQPPPDYDGRCPFPGLLAFGARYAASGQKEQDDRAFFFGREALVDKLVGRLMEHGFLAVLGPSGCGKSSLVLAGMVPALQARLPRLRVAYVQPGSEPLAQLEAALSGASGGDGRPNLIVVDQFEELFTLCRHESKRQGFVDHLLALSTNTALVLTMRADFWGECAAFPGLKDEMQAHQELVAPMDATALRRATERQADHVGLRFEAGLGEAILEDVEGEPGAMPLLQHALLLLWQRRHGRWLRWEEYRAIGGIQQAIAHTADEVYLDLARQEQARMRDILLRLTRLEEAPAGAEARDTRRRVGLAELVPAGSEPAETIALVKRLADARLVVTSRNAASGQEEVEVAHEALIRHWPRLRGWLEEDRAELHLHEGVGEAALEWEANEQEEAYLVHRGGRLEDAEALRQQPRFALNELEEAYVEACVGLRERERQERAERRRKELEAARKLAAEQQARAEEQAASATRMRRRALLLAGAVVVAVILAAVAFLAFRQADLNASAAQAASTQAVAGQSAAETAQALEADQRATAEAESWARATQEARAVASEAEANRQKGIAETQAARAEANLAIAEARLALIQIVVQSLNQLDRRLDLALLLGVEAFRQEDLLETRHLLFQGWSHTPELSRFLRGHRAQLYSVAWSADGRLASGGWDDKIIIWDPQSSEPLKILEGHASPINSVAWSPDGRLLASGYHDGGVIVWDPQSGEQVEPRLEGHASAINSVAWSPDGRLLASGSGDNTVIVWDLAKENLGPGEPAQLRLEGHQSGVNSVAWSADGRLASGSHDGSVIVWNVQSGQPPQILEEYVNGVTGVAWSADGRLAFGVWDDRTVIVWDPQSSEPLKILEGHAAGVSSVAWSEDGRLASGAWDNNVIVWDLDTGKPDQTLKGHTNYVTSVAWSADGRLLASGSGDNTAILWEVERVVPAQTLEGHTEDVSGVAWSKDGRLASGSGDDTVILWDLDTGEADQILPEQLDRVSSVAWSADGRLASGGCGNLDRGICQQGKIVVWDPAKESSGPGEPLQTLERDQAWFGSVAWSKDGHLASGLGDGTVIVWDPQSSEPAEDLEGHSRKVESVAWSADGRLLASGSEDATVIVWDPAEESSGPGEPLHTLEGHGTTVNSVAWSADGRLLASGSHNRIIVWDLSKEGAAEETFKRRVDDVESVAWSADGRLASGTYDGSIIVWDLERGLPVHTLEGRVGTVWSVAWSADGRRLASGSRDGTVQVWDMDPEEWIRQACYRAGRNLTRDEWDLYFPDEEYRQTCAEWP